MKTKSLGNLTIEELDNEVQTTKVLCYSSCFLVAILVCCSIFITYQQGFGVFTVLPVTFFTFIVITRKNYIEAKKELASRTSINI